MEKTKKIATIGLLIFFILWFIFTYLYAVIYPANDKILLISIVVLMIYALSFASIMRKNRSN